MTRRARRVAVLLPLTLLTAACTTGATAGEASTTPPATTPRPTTTSSTSTTSTSTTSTSTTTAPSTTTIAFPADLVDAPSPVDGAAAVLVAADATAPELAAVDAVVRRAATLWPGGASSIGVAVSAHGRTVGTWAAGADARGVPLDPSARFRLASVSKPVTALAVMRLVEAGLVHLDEPLLAQWQAPAAPADPRFGAITVRHLLEHGSGLPDMRSSFFGSAGVADWHEAAVRALATSLHSTPGTAFDYSNANYALLGELIEQTTGLDYEEAMRRLVFAPLGITDAALVPTASAAEGDPAYAVRPGRRYLEALGPAGAWAMSPADAARVTGALDPASTPALLTPATLAEMSEPGVPDPHDEWDYGLGLMLFPDAPGHTGTIENVRSFAVTLTNGYQVVVLTASGGFGDGLGLMARFAGELTTVAALPAR